MTKTEKFISKAIEIANDNLHGYSQYDRWIKDYDCSSLMYICGYAAGYDLPKSGTRYTGTMINHFTNAGFKAVAFDGNLNDLDAGDILLNTTHHTAVYIGDGKIVEASSDENGNIGGLSGDQTGLEIHIGNVYNYPWTHILIPPQEQENEKMNELKPIDIWRYKNAALENTDVYQIIRDTRNMCKQILKELAAIEVELSKLKNK